MTHYAWIIDTDHLVDGKTISRSEVGVTGPRSAPIDLLKRLQKGAGARFELFDDDGELCYTGRVIERDPKTSLVTAEPVTEEGCFGPLDDFGRPSAGCTTIKINGKAI